MATHEWDMSAGDWLLVKACALSPNGDHWLMSCDDLRHAKKFGTALAEYRAGVLARKQDPRSAVISDAVLRAADDLEQARKELKACEDCLAYETQVQEELARKYDIAKDPAPFSP